MCAEYTEFDPVPTVNIIILHEVHTSHIILLPSAEGYVFALKFV